MKDLVIKISILCGLLVSISAYAENQALTYSLNSPYSGEANLVITNHGAQDVNLHQITFDVDVPSIDSASVYGTMLPYGAKLTQTASSNQYTIIEPASGLTIAASQSVNLSFATKGAYLDMIVLPRSVTADGQNLTVDGACSGAACQDPGQGKRIMGYYSDWARYARNYMASDIPADKINTVIYSFLGFDAQGNVSLLDAYADGFAIPTIAQMRAQYPYMHASISFGGWTLSYLFHDMANNPAARANFVSQAVQAMRQFHFDGIDIDWEYPVVNGAPNESAAQTPEDAKNYVQLLQDLRTALNKASQQDHQQYYLTIAGAGGEDKLAAVDNAYPGAYQQITKVVDYADIMSYDFHGAFDQSQEAPYNVSNFQSAMQLDPTMDPTVKSSSLSQYNVVDAVAGYEKHGFPASKVVLGIPTYGRLVSIKTISAQDKGLYQPITGTPAGEFDDWSTGNTGVYNYKCIAEPTLCHSNTDIIKSLTYVDPNKDVLGKYSQTPWGFSNDYFITYDDNYSAANKARWALQNNLGGVMVWELSSDFKNSEDNPNNPKQIVAAIKQVFTDGK